MLIYKGLDIGSAKPTPEERCGIPHHLIDIVEPTDRFTTKDWLRLAHQAIAGIQSRGGLPIVVGGTNLYIKSLVDGMFDGPGEDQVMRAQLPFHGARGHPRRTRTRRPRCRSPCPPQ